MLWTNEKDLTCTFRVSFYSARLSWALVLTWVSPFVQDKKVGYFVTTFALKEGGRKEIFYLTTHSTHFIYDYMASDIWLRTILIVSEETRCRHMGYSFRLAARLVLYAPSHRQDSTYHGICYTSRGALAGTRNSSMGPPHEGSIRQPIALWANALTTELHLTPSRWRSTTAQYNCNSEMEKKKRGGGGGLWFIMFLLRELIPNIKMCALN